MEDVLDVYMRSHNPARPLVCLDETSKQLVGETRTPEPMQSGRLARHDYEHKRKDVANMRRFVFAHRQAVAVSSTEQRPCIHA